MHAQGMAMRKNPGMRRPRAAGPGRPWRAALVAVVLLAVAVAGCGIPRDPERTLARVRGGTLRAGITASEPWTTLEGGRPGGVEVELVERFADELGATVGFTGEQFRALPKEARASVYWKHHGNATAPMP